MLTLFKILGTILGLTLVDLYILRAIQSVPWKWWYIKHRRFKRAFWVCSTGLTSGLLLGVYVIPLGVGYRSALLLIFFLALACKICILFFFLVDEFRRILRPGRKLAAKEPKAQINREPVPNAIPRSEFLVKAGLLAGSIPIAYMGITMRSNLYDYQIVRQNLYLPNLPKAFDGMTIGQISDIHSGSFYNKTAVLGGVEMLMRDKADVIFFTGDLVNMWSSEMKNYQDIFAKVKAPLGVFSCLGNHDYGDYHNWTNLDDKAKNHKKILDSHKAMGWDLLRNENRRLKVDGEEIGILGVENWGLYSPVPKYGRMDLAVKNTNDLPVKLLLSHDPTHWRAEVLPKYPQIDATFAGHTHGMQFGVQTGHIKWSPVEYVYRDWSGLYTENSQQLYVNVGFGFFMMVGRVGILPEITIFTLKAGNASKMVKT